MEMRTDLEQNRKEKVAAVKDRLKQLYDQEKEEEEEEKSHRPLAQLQDQLQPDDSEDEDEADENESEEEEDEEKSSSSPRADFAKVFSNHITHFLMGVQSDLLFQEEYEAFVFFTEYVLRYHGDPNVLPPSTEAPKLTVFLRSSSFSPNKAIQEVDYCSMIDWGLILLEKNAKEKFLTVQGSTLLKNLPPRLFTDYSRYKSERDQQKNNVYISTVKPILRAVDTTHMKKFTPWITAFYLIPGIYFLASLPKVAQHFYNKRWLAGIGDFFVSLLISCIPILPAYRVYREAQSAQELARVAIEDWGNAGNLVVRSVTAEDHQAHKVFRKQMKGENITATPTIHSSLQASKAHKVTIVHKWFNVRTLIMDAEQNQRYSFREKWRTAPSSITSTQTQSFFTNLTQSKLDSRRCVDAAFHDYEKMPESQRNSL